MIRSLILLLITASLTLLYFTRGQSADLDQRFKALDRNNDGLLIEAELPRRQWFERLDTNKDGQVTREEARKVVAAMLKRGESLPRLPSEEVNADSTHAVNEPALTEAPAVIKGSAVGVGRRLPDLELTDVQKQSLKFSSALAEAQGLIMAYFGATCPISGKLGPELVRLEKEAVKQGLEMLLVCPVAAETTDDIQTYIKTHGLTSRVIHDQDQRLSHALSATTTTEVFLLDATRTLIYRGAINDQYGLGYSKPAATKTYLCDAMKAMQRSQLPEITATTAPGCALDLKTEVASIETKLTYHDQIQRILQARCVECHRADGVGPFSLETYEDVIENAAMIRKQVERGVMPPWFAAAAPKDEHSPWLNDASLSPQDKNDLLSWLASDRAKGDPADAPRPLIFPKEWAMGQPDAIVQLPKPVSIKAEGTMPYQFITVPTEFAEDRWVRGYEILPTDASVVHHVIVQVHAKGAKNRNRGEGSEGYWAAYVPGNTHHLWPEHFAKKLPAGATVSFQIHYTPNGKETQDQLRLGLHFAEETPRYIVHTASVANPRLNIPAGASDHLETKEQAVPFDMHVMAYMAHLHLRGKAFKYEVTRPGQSPEILLDIPRYDFNWQLRYDYAQPRFIPKGSKVTISAVFDNSPGNPANPDPTRNIRWGPQTEDEMMIGYVEYYTANSGG